MLVQRTYLVNPTPKLPIPLSLNGEPEIPEETRNPNP